MSVVNLEQRRFEKLTVSTRCGSNRRGDALWRCLCDCGNETVVKTNNLTSGKTKSCGCLYRTGKGKSGRIPHNRQDYSGRRFGRWLVQSLSHRDYDARGDTRTFYNCVCDCGTERIVATVSLVTAQSKSCGCLHKEVARENGKKNGGSQKLPMGEAAFNQLYGRYKHSAKRCGRTFSISKDLFRTLTEGRCHYCNAAPSKIAGMKGNHGMYIYNGIDRIDNEVGYEPSNCVSCCATCNYMKRDIDYVVFTTWIKGVYENLELQRFGLQDSH